MHKKIDNKSFWQAKLRPLRRVGTITLAATIALSVPAVSNVVSEVSPFNNLQVTVAHAQTDNLMDSNDILTTFYYSHNDEYEHWTNRLGNSGDMVIDGPEFDLTDVKYVVKFPSELSHLLTDEYVTDYLFGNVINFDSAQNPFTLTGDAIDESGETITIGKDEHQPYHHISINHETNSLEFDMNSFYSANDLEPYIRQSVSGEYIFNTLSFDTPIVVPDSRMLYNGTYEFKTAIVRGSAVDLDNVGNAYSVNLEVDYSEDGEYPEPEPEEPEVDTGALESLVEEANTYDANDYTDESFEALTTALTGAEVVLGNDEATQDEVDAALETLQNAIEGLEAVDEKPTEPEEPVELDTEALESSVEEANNLNAADYTEDSFADLTIALTEAEALLENDEATQDQVDAALVALNNALDGLERAGEPEPEPEDPVIDTEELEQLIEEAKDYSADDYTDASFAALTSAVSAAEAVLEDANATEEDVATALESIQSAIDNLDPAEPTEAPVDDEEEVVNTTDLKELVDKANDFASKNYTEDSFATLTSALANAEDILENSDATQEEVNAALAELQAAIDELVKAEKLEIDEKDEKDEKDGEESVVATKDKEDGERLPDTATNTYSLLLLGGLLTIAGGATLFIRRKKLV